MAKLTQKQQMHLAVLQRKALLDGYFGVSFLCNAVRSYVYTYAYYNNKSHTRAEIQCMIDAVQSLYDYEEKERRANNG